MTDAEVMERATELQEDARAVTQAIVLHLDGDEVGRVLERFADVVRDQPVGVIMVAFSMLIAELAAGSPNEQMFQAVLLEMTTHALATRPDRPAVH